VQDRTQWYTSSGDFTLERLARRAVNSDAEGQVVDFSVVICTYNSAHLLGDALHTVAEQTLRHFEVIVLDDGSTDNTASVVESFQPRIPRLRYCPQPHREQAASRNTALGYTTGKYVAFLDADDLWSANYLAHMKREFSEKPEMEGAFSNGLIILNSGKVIRPFFPAGLLPLAGSIGTSAALFSFFRFVTPSALVLRKSAFDRAGSFDRRFSNYGWDWHWLIRAARLGLKFLRVDEKLVLYRRHDGNLTHNTAAMFDAWLRMYEDPMRRSPLDSEQERYAQRFTCSLLPGLLATCPPARSRELLREALKEFPQERSLKLARAATFVGGAQFLRIVRACKHRLLGLQIPRQQPPAPSAVFDLLRSMSQR
jgi:GT2 family glycosyltransferase